MKSKVIAELIGTNLLIVTREEYVENQAWFCEVCRSNFAVFVVMNWYVSECNISNILR